MRGSACECVRAVEHWACVHTCRGVQCPAGEDVWVEIGECRVSALSTFP